MMKVNLKILLKKVWTSSHDIKKSIKNEIQHFKAMKFKDLIANNDSKDMFDRLLIKLVDNTYYEIDFLVMNLVKN